MISIMEVENYIGKQGVGSSELKRSEISRMIIILGMCIGACIDSIRSIVSYRGNFSFFLVVSN
jgi:hypothetical protein